MDMDLIPGQGTKIPHATGQVSLHTTTREAWAPQWEALTLQLEKAWCNKDPVQQQQ